jgi:pimeloyl-ACP methyl ester carboxylesterase
MRHTLHFIAKLVAFSLIFTGAFAQDNPLARKLENLGAEPCDLGELTCLTISVPLNHFANDPDQTIDVTFAVSLATEHSAGLLFYVVGGPGGSGLSVADDYLAAFDETLPANLDIVFFDQRGIGPNTGLTCAVAASDFDNTDLPLDQPDAILAAVKTFVADCQTELDHPELLLFASTNQAIRDLELFRQTLGIDKVWIYGESYGTQYAQQYATEFPDVIQGVILDGVVDLNLSFEGFYRTYITEAEKILARVLDACTDIAICGNDMQGSLGRRHQPNPAFDPIHVGNQCLLRAIWPR